jgi:hypothetical protein
VRPFGSHVRPPPLQHAPVRARARSRTRPRPDTCPHHNGCARIAFRPREDIVFAPGPTRLRPLTCVCARRVCAHSPRPVPRVRAWSPRPFLPVRARRVCARIRGRAKNPRPVHASAPRVRARSHASAPRVRARSHQSAPGPTRPRPLARVRAQRVRAFTRGRTRSTARATSARPQSFPTCAPYSHVRPQQYINPFTPPHKSLCS